MAAPTWPPGPEEALAASRQEYGHDPALSDDEVEAALLAPFLFGEPARSQDGEQVGGTLAERSRTLAAWLTLLAGRPIAVDAADPPATDGRTIFLPPALPAPVNPAEDALIYRVMAYSQLAICESGLLGSRALLGEIHGDWVYRSCLHLLLVRARLARIRARWPGSGVDIEAARLLPAASRLYVNHTEVPRKGMPHTFNVLLEGLIDSPAKTSASGPSSPSVNVARSAVAAVDSLKPDAPGALLIIAGQASRLRLALREDRLGPPPIPWIFGVLRPEWVLDLDARDLVAESAWREGPAPLRLLRRVIRGPRAVLPQEGPKLGIEARPAASEGARYDEWDVEARRWRLGHTLVFETEAQAGDQARAVATRDALSDLIAQVRRRFAALKPDDRPISGQIDGPELDLGRLLTAMGDLAAGQTPRQDWHRAPPRRRPPLAVMVLVDCSGSTAGEVLGREIEALFTLSEGLDALGAAYSLYGFHNHGPADCRMTRLKGWDERSGPPIWARMIGLRAAGATRLGAFIRHASAGLSRRPEPRRLLLLLSDGRPEDGDGYRGPRGIADSALAVAETRRRDIAVRVISLDTRTEDTGYLSTIFGSDGALVLSDISELPRRAPDWLAHILT